MPDTLRRPVVLDTTVLSNFASVESVEWLVDFLDDPVVPPAVEEEIERGRRHGHSFLSDVTNVLGDEIVRVTPNETTTRSIIRERLDPGEAESLVLAVEQDGTLATDDLAARELAREHDVPVTGSIGLLVAGIESDQLTVAVANDWLDTWRSERDYYAPVEDVGGLLDDGG